MKYAQQAWNKSVLVDEPIIFITLKGVKETIANYAG